MVEFVGGERSAGERLRCVNFDFAVITLLFERVSSHLAPFQIFSPLTHRVPSHGPTPSPGYNQGLLRDYLMGRDGMGRDRVHLCIVNGTISDHLAVRAHEAGLGHNVELEKYVV